MIALVWTVRGLYSDKRTGAIRPSTYGRASGVPFFFLYSVSMFSLIILVSPSVRCSDSGRAGLGDLMESKITSQGVEKYAKNEILAFSFFAYFKGRLDIGSLVLLPPQRCFRGYPEMGSQGTGPRLIVGERLYR